jgi:hypothetical protein
MPGPSRARRRALTPSFTTRPQLHLIPRAAAEPSPRGRGIGPACRRRGNDACSCQEDAIRHRAESSQPSWQPVSRWPERREGTARKRSAAGCLGRKDEESAGSGVRWPSERALAMATGGRRRREGGGDGRAVATGGRWQQEGGGDGRAVATGGRWRREGGHRTSSAT